LSVHLPFTSPVILRFILFFYYIIFYLPNHLSWNASGNTIVRDILCDDGASGNYNIIPDGDTGQYGNNLSNSSL